MKSAFSPKLKYLIKKSNQVSLYSSLKSSLINLKISTVSFRAAMMLLIVQNNLNNKSIFCFNNKRIWGNRKS